MINKKTVFHLAVFLIVAHGISVFAMNDDPKPDADVEHNFSEANPHYVDRAGAFYEIEYVVPSAEGLFDVADVRAGQMRKTLRILRGFVYDWLEAYVEGNGSINRAEVLRCVERMDERFEKLLDDRQYEKYLTWKNDASGEHNQLQFLISFGKAPRELEIDVLQSRE